MSWIAVDLRARWRDPYAEDTVNVGPIVRVVALEMPDLRKEEVWDQRNLPNAALIVRRHYIGSDNYPSTITQHEVVEFDRIQLELRDITIE